MRNWKVVKDKLWAATYVSLYFLLHIYINNLPNSIAGNTEEITDNEAKSFSPKFKTLLFVFFPNLRVLYIFLHKYLPWPGLGVFGTLLWPTIFIILASSELTFCREWAIGLVPVACNVDSVSVGWLFCRLNAETNTIRLKLMKLLNFSLKF